MNSTDYQGTFTFASVFGKTTPIEPGINSQLGGTEIAEKVVSVIPKPYITEVKYTSSLRSGCTELS